MSRSRTNVDVVVEFPGSGRVTRVDNVAANGMIRVLESAGKDGYAAEARRQSERGEE